MILQVLINIDVDDLARAVEFYCTALELKVGRRFGDAGVELLGGSSAIYLLPKEAGTVAADGITEQRRYERHWTPVHLDFVVPEIEPAVKKALGAGARLERDVQTAKWGRIAMMADPFGHGFCLIEFLGRGYDEIAS